MSLFIPLETVFSPIWVWLALGEKPPAMTLVGAFLIIPVLVFHSWLGMREENLAKGFHGNRYPE